MNKADLYKTIESWTGSPINDSTLIFEDLGMDGLDCWTFMEQVAENFEVDISSYNWEDYHFSDADVNNIFKKLYWLLFDKKKVIKKSFTAQHLYQVVLEKKWFEP